MQSEEETLEVLLAIHFPNSVITKGWQSLLLPDALDDATDRWLRMFSPTRGLNGQLILLSSIKVQEWMEFSQPCCKRDEDFFCACLATGYVPAIWHQDKVVFIPKHGRSSYTGPRDFRTISLTSLLLKTRERLVDRYFKG